jgi:hypothetical protein
MMCEKRILKAYLREADLHIDGAEIVLRDLGTSTSTPMRRMRAAMYVKAMRRLRALMAAHRSLPWNQGAPAAPAEPERPHHWPIRWPRRPSADSIGHECRDR